MTDSTTTAATTLPYPNALQERRTTDEHRRIAAAAVFEYRQSVAEEQARLRQDDVVVSEEEAARLQRRVEAQQSANATAEQFRQRACDVVNGVEDSEDAVSVTHSINKRGDGLSSSGSTVDVFHAACDGDVAALSAWVASVPPSLLPLRINALGQPDPATYNGVQFQQRWLFRAPPLVFAAAFGREGATAFLLAHGADALVKSSTGLRALDYAEKRGYANIALMLRGGM